MSRRVLLLANCKSRRCAECLPDVRAILVQHGFDLNVPELPPTDQLQALIEREARSADCVIVMGGDGTISTALPGLLAVDRPVGLIPTGTANDLARTLDLPTDPAEAVAVIVAGATREIDVATVNGRPFINAASMGLSVRITRLLSRDFKKRWGVFAYFLAACQAMLRVRRFRATMTADDGPEIAVRSVQIVIGNGMYFGGGMAVADNARIDDHRLNGYSINARRWWNYITLIPSLRHGTHRSDKRVTNISGRKIVIKPRHPHQVTADGEIVGRTPATFELHPKRLNIFVKATDDQGNG